MNDRPRGPSAPRLRPSRIAALLGLAWLGIASPTMAGGLTPQEARDRMVVPEGFRVEVFASEPEIRQPVSACFDERGRLWVIEYLQYPVPAGLKPVSIDQYLRTEYDRVPEPPPRGPRGADRIKILEDTDGDGHADKVTTFVEGLNLASGLAVGHGGVFVGQAPYLLFYPDRDRDDRPDGDPEVLLTGFGLQDAHATVNSMMWGPDGWLYGAQGSTVTANIRGIGFQQGIWRYEPRSKRFELFAEGGGNTWGLDFDRAGNAFGSSNGGFVAFHMVQGGYYWKGFAKHGPLHNPNTFGYFNNMEYHGRKPGGHVTPGGIIYKGSAFPDEFDGAFIGGNLLANTAYWYKRSPKGSTFSLRLGGTFLDAKDPWFRPIDLLTGPDGSVFVVDWYDQRASHLDPRDNWDKTNGRIYKISYQGAKSVTPFDLARESSDELIDLRGRANDWWPDMARRILAERRDPAVLPRLRELVRQDRDEAIALRDLWACYVSGGMDEATAAEWLDHPVAGVRRWAVRLLGDDAKFSEAIATRLVRLAREEPDPLVRSQLAATCQRVSADVARAILLELIRRSEDAKDEHIPLLIWWAVERHMRPDPAFALAFGDSATQTLPIVREALLERIARVLSGRGRDEDFAVAARLLDAAPSDAERDRLVAGLDKGLEGRRLERVPAALEGPLRTLGHASLARLRLAARLGSESALREVLGRAGDPKASQVDRVALIELVGQIAASEGFDSLAELLDRDEPEPIRSAAVDALARSQRPELAGALLDRYDRLSGPSRAKARGILASRKDWAGRLLDAMAAGRIAPKELTLAQALQIAQHGDADLTARLEEVWGRLPGPGSPEKVRRIAEVRGVLPEGDKGDPARGRSVFQQACAGCHRLFGEGETIGPELTGVERGDLDFLLTSLVDPSAVIRKEFQGQTVALNDGRVLNGLVVEESEKAITLFDGQKQKTVIPREDVESIKPSPVSVMPEGLLDNLSDGQVRDLFRYLQSNGPATIPR